MAYYRSKIKQAEILTEEMFNLAERFNYYRRLGDKEAVKAITNQQIGLEQAFYALDIPIRVRHNVEGYIYEIIVMREPPMEVEWREKEEKQ